MASLNQSSPLEYFKPQLPCPNEKLTEGISTRTIREMSHRQEIFRAMDTNRQPSSFKPTYASPKCYMSIQSGPNKTTSV